MKQVTTWLVIGVISVGLSACGGAKPAEPAAAPAPAPAAPAPPPQAAAPATDTMQTESALDFELVNATGYDIKELYLSPSDVKNWEENMVPAGELFKNASSTKISFTGYKSDVELWDLKAVEDNGDEHVYDDLKLTAINKLTLNAEDATIE